MDGRALVDFSPSHASGSAWKSATAPWIHEHQCNQAGMGHIALGRIRASALRSLLTVEKEAEKLAANRPQTAVKLSR